MLNQTICFSHSRTYIRFYEFESAERSLRASTIYWYSQKNAVQCRQVRICRAHVIGDHEFEYIVYGHFFNFNTGTFVFVDNIGYFLVHIFFFFSHPEAEWDGPDRFFFSVFFSIACFKKKLNDEAIYFILFYIAYFIFIFITIMLSSSSSLSIYVPSRKTAMAKSRSFSSVACDIWNKLPCHLSSIPALPAFRKRLKHHLFSSAFPGVSSPSADITLLIRT